MVLPSSESRNLDAFSSFKAEQLNELYVSMENDNEDMPNKQQSQGDYLILGRQA